MTDEPDLKQKEKDEALQRRKEELEAELDRYARAGAFSPGLIKASRWVSRGLYLAMGIAFMAMLFSGWGKYSEDEFNQVKEGYTKWKKEAEDQKKAREEAESRVVEAELRAAQLRLQFEAGSEADELARADAAMQAARELIERAWGERAYAQHWREKLARAEPDAHGVEPVAGVAALIRQAAHASSGARLELMRESADFGEAAVKTASETALGDSDVEVRKVAVRLLSRAGGLGDPRQRDERDENVLREMWFCYGAGEQSPHAIDTWYAEAYVGFGLAVHTRSDKLDQTYRQAPEEKRIELLALLAECADTDDSGLFAMVATSQRPMAEKIIAVRWMGEREDEGSKALLKTLSEGKDVLAAEALVALKKIGD